MLFYDIEVFKYDWLVVIYDNVTKSYTKIWNDEELLTDFYNKNTNNIWLGFNNKHYDQYIFKGILLGMNPKSINDRIIKNGENGWMIIRNAWKIRMINYDVMQRGDGGLKSFEGMMGHNIYESSIPFDIDRALTPDEQIETESYCINDVNETMELFYDRESRLGNFKALFELVKMYKMPLDNLGRTPVQLASKILDSQRNSYDDEFNISIPTNLKISKYIDVVNWYKSDDSKHYTDNKFCVDVADVPHVFGWGGVHGAIEKYHESGCFVNMDVASLYPSLMIEYDLISRSCDATKFKDIVDLRLKYKAEHNPIQKALKIVINGSYGASKDKNNNMYDPLMANNVCVHGQLLMLDLIEHLEPYCKIIQSNTDGVLIKIDDFNKSYDKIIKVADEWQARARLTLEFDKYVKVYQKDVNNYVVIAEDGHYKSKGGYVKELNKVDYDLPIVNEALINYMTKNIPVEKTITSCDQLIKFQMIRKITGKYKNIKHGDEILNVRCIRCFASTDKKDGGLQKLSLRTNNYDKISGTPINSFLVLDNVENVSIMKERLVKLDYTFYIKMANQRLNDFGIGGNNVRVRKKTTVKRQICLFEE